MSHAAQQPEPGSPPPGWYPDPGAFNAMRYWDGWQWTAQSAPMPPPAQLATGAVMVRSGDVNHVLHLLLTVFSCGVWAPIWLLAAISNQPHSSAPRSTKATVGLIIAIVAFVAVAAAMRAHR